MSPETTLKSYQVPLAWGLLVLALAVLVAGVVKPLVKAYAEGSERLDEGYGRLAKLEAIARQQPEAIRRQEAAVDEALEHFAYPATMNSDRLLLELRKMMETLAEKHDVQLQSVESRTPKADEGLASVVLAITAQSGLDGTIGLFKDLRDKAPMLVVDDISVNAVSSRRSRRSRRLPAPPPTQGLGLKFRVEGFLVRGAS